MADPVGFWLALAVVAVGLLAGHTILFWLLRDVVQLDAHRAIRGGHTLGGPLGWCFAASLLPRTRDVVAFWTGVPPLPGGVVLVLLLGWLLIVWFYRRPAATPVVD
ncbi:MAG: hypothetical protein IT204_17210 [Fimbriimonadaceae bacterium]|nr:hypothetical protein [Fimbriimonadaceae bacterium]